MMTFIILSRLTPESHAHSGGLKAVARAVSKKIKEECPDVVWKGSFATMGRFDVVDIVEADDPAEIAKVAAIISSVGRASTETLPAMRWKDYLSAL